MLTVKGKTIVFLTAGDLLDAGDQGRKTNQVGQDGQRPPGWHSTSNQPSPTTLADVIRLLNEADYKLMEARGLLRQAFELIGRVGE